MESGTDRMVQAMEHVKAQAVANGRVLSEEEAYAQATEYLKSEEGQNLTGRQIPDSKSTKRIVYGEAEEPEASQ